MPNRGILSHQLCTVPAGGAKNINFQELAADLAQITYAYPFEIPPYFGASPVPCHDAIAGSYLGPDVWRLNVWRQAS